MKRLILTTALALFAAPALAEEPATKWKWGCEWQQADNGNYWFRVDGGCPIHMALGYASANEMRGKDVPPATEDDDEEPSDPGDGEGPGDDEGPGDEGGEGPGDGGQGEGPGDGDNGPGDDKPGNGYGDDNHDHSGPPGQGNDKPGKGKGKGGKGKGRN